MVQRPLFAVVLSASATFEPYRGASCSAWQSRSFLSAVFLHRHNSNLVRAFGQPKRRVGSLRRSGRRIADEGRGGRRETCAWHPRAGREPSNCDLNMRPAPYAEHGEVVSWLFRPEMRRGDSGFVFRPDEISVFALVLFRCRLRMQLFSAAARSCGRRAGSRIGRLRDSAVSRPRFRVCVVARAFGGGCRSAACSCRRRSQHIRSLRPRGAFSSPPAG